MTENSSSPTAAAPGRRFRFRYGLRTLFVLMTIIAVWLGFTMHAARQRAGAVVVISKAGGVVVYDYEIGTGMFVSIANPPRGPAWLNEWAGVDLMNRAELVFFSNGLLARSDTDRRETVRQLSQLTTLRRLSLCDSELQEEDLENLTGLTNLTALYLSGNNLSDNELRHLASLTMLRTLHLDRNPLTDACLIHLEKLPNLQNLDLNETQVTSEGVAKLKQALPGLNVELKP